MGFNPFLLDRETQLVSFASQIEREIADLSNTTDITERRLLIPAFKSLYESAETILRVVAGLALVTHGFIKILDPFGASAMLEGLGFYPGPSGLCCSPAPSSSAGF